MYRCGAAAPLLELLHTRNDGCGRGQLLPSVPFISGPITDFDRIAAAGDFDYRRAAEDSAKRAGSMVADVMMIPDPGDVADLPQYAQQQIDVETSLVRLVDDQRVVSAERPVTFQLLAAGCRRS